MRAALAPSVLLRVGPLLLAALSLGACPRRGPPLLAVDWQAREPGLETASAPLGERSQLRVVRFDQTRFTLGLLSPAGGLHVPDDAPKEAVAIWNGGYFEPDLRPSGLVLDQGREVSAPSAGSALLLLGDRFSLVRFRAQPASSTPPGALTRSALSKEGLPAGPTESALQLWPFLIEPGGADGIRRDDGKHARRSAVALDDAGRGLLVGVLGDGVSLHELMDLCRRLGAVVAANLDGGPSTGFALTGAPDWRIPSETTVANALVLTTRPGRAP